MGMQEGKQGDGRSNCSFVCEWLLSGSGTAVYHSEGPDPVEPSRIGHLGLLIARVMNLTG